MAPSFPLAGEIMERIEALAAISESPKALIRRYLTPEHRRVNEMVRGWMVEAGMSARVDAIGNIIGRYEGMAPGAPALMIGSHLDTVVDAGKYDGMLGVLTGIACVQALNRSGKRLGFAVEVIGFADEEGARFQSTFLGSRAVAGTFDYSLLEREDADGITLRQAMVSFGLDPDEIASAARRANEILAYLELHIEQGPVLEQHGLAVGLVTAIAGATRLAVTVQGQAGHAGTVPMALRADALAAASECVLAVEAAAKAGRNRVGTVGKITAEPGAINVIPGQVGFTIDFRAEEDEDREAGLAELAARIGEISKARAVEIAIETVHQAESVACAPGLMAQIGTAIEAHGHHAIALPSGAGHDASAMAGITEVGMIFVRCKDGISHHPAEAITEADAAAGADVLLRVIENFQGLDASLAADRPQARTA